MAWIFGILIVVAVAYLWLRSASVAPEDEDASPDAPPDDLPDAPLGDSIDLHGLPPAEAGPLVDAYIEEARRQGFSMVRIIHGRGIGAMRRTVRVHLERSPHVLRFGDAPPPSGRGATVVELRSEDAPPERDIATGPDTH